MDCFEGREALQRDLDRPESWAIMTSMTFKKNKCQILHLRWGNPAYTYNIGDKRLESSSTERGLGVWVDGGLNISPQCALVVKRANRVLGYITHSIDNRPREVIVPVYTAWVWRHLKYCVQFGEPQYEKDIRLLKCVLRRVTKIMRGLEGHTSEDAAEVTWFVQPEEEKAEG